MTGTGRVPRVGLAGEILFAFSVVTLFAIGLNAAVVWRITGMLDDRERLEGALTTARLLAATAGTEPDPAVLRAARDRVHGLEAAVVFDANGMERARVGPVPPPEPVPDVLGVLTLGEDRAVSVPVGGIERRIRAVVPVGSAEAPIGAVAVWITYDRGAASARASRIVLSYVVLNAMLAGGLGWYLVSRSVVRPARSLAAAANRVASGDLTAKVDVGSGNELGELARDFNRMTTALAAKDAELARQLQDLRDTNARLEAAKEELVRSEKLASVGRLAAGVAHELGNPVTAVLGYVTGMLRGREADTSNDADALRRVEREARRMDRIIRDLLDLARPREESIEAIDVDAVAEGVLSLVSSQKAFRGIEIVRRLGGPGRALADEHRLQQVLVNLLVNAADAVETMPRKRIVVESGTGEFPGADAPMRRRDDPGSGAAVFLRVTDTGCGIAEKDLATLFDPFFTTKPPGRGTGLGLAVSRQLVESAGGRITVSSTPGEGATFTVFLRPAAVDRAGTTRTAT